MEKNKRHMEKLGYVVYLCNPNLQESIQHLEKDLSKCSVTKKKIGTYSELRRFHSECSYPKTSLTSLMCLLPPQLGRKITSNLKNKSVSITKSKLVNMLIESIEEAGLKLITI